MFSVPFCVAQYNVTGGGASSQSLLWDMLCFSYRGVDHTSLVHYIPSTSAQGLSDMDNRTINFAGSDVMQPQTTLDSYYLNQFPISATAIALLFNVVGVHKLVLDRQTIVDIFSGKIQFWNDPAISSLNPSFLFPNASILIINRKGGSGTNQVFTEALKTFDPSFNLSNDPSTWPFSHQGRSIQTKESADISSFVANTPNSLGYVAHPFANRMATVSIINKSGRPINPNKTTVHAAFTDNLQGHYFDSDHPDAYPIVTPTFILYPRDTNKDCRYTLAMAEMLYWASSSSLAAQAGAYRDYTQMPSHLLESYTQLLTKIKCNGKSAYNYLHPYETTLLVLGLFMACICFFIVGLVFLARNLFSAKPWGLIITILGHAASYASVILWIGYPSDWICKARPLIIFLTFISVVVQLNETIVYMFTLTKIRRRFGPYLEEKISVALFAINLIIILSWLGAYPPSEKHRRCTGKNQNEFLYTLLGYNILLIGGAFACNMYARHVKKRNIMSFVDPNQQTTLIAIFTACLYVPINFLNFRKSNYTFIGLLLSPATGTIIYSTLQISVVIMPQIIKPLRKLLSCKQGKVHDVNKNTLRKMAYPSNSSYTLHATTVKPSTDSDNPLSYSSDIPLNTSSPSCAINFKDPPSEASDSPLRNSNA